MTILFVGGEDIDFRGNVVDSGLTTAYYDSTYSRTAVQPSISAVTGGFYPAYDFASAQTEAWLHCNGRQATQSGSTVNYFMSFSSAAKIRAAGVKKSSQGNNGVLFCDNGAGVELLGTAFTFPDSPGEYDLHVKITALSALVEVYYNSVLVKSETFTLTTTFTLTSFEFAAQGPTPSWSLSFSQIVAATESTIGWKVFTRPPTGDGAETGFTGTYAAVDDKALDTTDLITTAVAAKRTFTRASLTIPGGNDIKGVAVVAYGRTGLPAIDDIKMLVRKSGVNYASSSQVMSPGYKYFSKIWETDPATSAIWDNTLISGTSLEFGIEVL